MSPVRITAGFAALLLVAAACGGGDDDADDTVPTTTTTTEVPTTDPPQPTTSATTTTAATTTTTTLPAIVRQPLTGEPLESEDDILQRPALAVKIDNHANARRNHSGFAFADIVFEEKVEGNLTRFAAVFHSRGADPVGPIRSGRSQDVAILSSFNEPLFAWSGGNPGVTRLIRASFLIDIGHTSSFGGKYYRGPGSAPHNLYSNTETLWEATPEDHPGPPTQQFVYLRPEESFEGEPATRVELNIGAIDIEWDWNEENGEYDRSQEGNPHNDVSLGRLGFENVVVMEVEYGRSSIDSSSPEAKLTGEGPVWIFSDGQVIEGTWKREDIIFRLQYFDEDGEEIAISPGGTWVELAESPPVFS